MSSNSRTRAKNAARESANSGTSSNPAVAPNPIALSNQNTASSNKQNGARTGTAKSKGGYLMGEELFRTMLKLVKEGTNGQALATEMAEEEMNEEANDETSG